MDPPENEHWNALQGRVTFLEINEAELTQAAPDPEGVQKVVQSLANNYPAGRSNVWRYLILRKFGGIYLDFDTLTLRDFKPLLDQKAFIGEEIVFKSEADRVAGKYRAELLYTLPAFLLSWVLTRINCFVLGNSEILNSVSNAFMKLWGTAKLNNAVLGAEPSSHFFGRALEAIPNTDPSIRYNLGPILMNSLWAQNSKGIVRYPTRHFYCIPPSQTIRFFSAWQDPVPNEAFVVHYCSSNEKIRAAKLTQEYLSKPPKGNSILLHQLSYPIIRKMNTKG
jgi:hypothetical protein